MTCGKHVQHEAERLLSQDLPICTITARNFGATNKRTTFHPDATYTQHIQLVRPVLSYKRNVKQTHHHLFDKIQLCTVHLLCRFINRYDVMIT